MIAMLHPAIRAFFCLLLEYAKIESKEGEGRDFDDTRAKNLSGACHGVSVKRGVRVGAGVGARVVVYLFFQEYCFRVRVRVRVDTNLNPNPK